VTALRCAWASEDFKQAVNPILIKHGLQPVGDLVRRGVSNPCDVDRFVLQVRGPDNGESILLPEMSEQEYRELVEDIRVNGLREGITITGGAKLILDGRHRYRALRELGIWEYHRHAGRCFIGSEAEQVAFVMSANIHRRNLTTQQRAHIAAELAKCSTGATGPKRQMKL
jgi:hypothetical protein